MIRRIAAYVMRRRVRALSPRHDSRAYVWLKKAREVARRILRRQ